MRMARLLYRQSTSRIPPRVLASSFHSLNCSSNVHVTSTTRSSTTSALTLSAFSPANANNRHQYTTSALTLSAFSPANTNNRHQYTCNQLWGGARFQSTQKTPIAAAAATTPIRSDEDDEDTKNAVVVKEGKPWLWDLGVPKLIPQWRNMLKTETLLTDVSAGITVGCIAVPLSLAIAVASGVPPEVGLVTAVVSGVAGGLLGGTTLAVTGPAAAISLLVVGAVQSHGLEALPFITLGCGGLQLASGVTRLGVAAKLVPVSVIAGFTTGVGIMILTGQIPKALGITAPPGMNPIETFMFLGENIGSVNPAAAALALGTSAGMFLLPKIHPKMPSALLAVGGATLATHGIGLDVALIGTIPSGLEAFQFAVPIIPPVDELPSLTATILLIYAMTSAESLLSCAALEKMKKTSYKHNPDQELIGQGLANMGAAMFMGMPVTSVIARSSLNVKLNAETRLPAIVQAGFVFSGVVFMSSSIAMIPMPALSGMLITTGMGMLNPAEFKHCYAVEKMDTFPFLATIAGMISFGLAEGIGIGCVSAMALYWDYGKLQTREVQLLLKDNDVVDIPAQQLLQDDDKAITAWQLEGPINFKSMFVIDDMMERLQESKTEEAIVVDCQGVTSVEFTGVEEMANRLIEVAHDKGIPVQLYHCHDELQNALRQCDPSQMIAANCELKTSDAPYHFPKLEKKPRTAPHPDVPIMMLDSPHFRPDR